MFGFSSEWGGLLKPIEAGYSSPLMRYWTATKKGGFAGLEKVRYCLPHTRRERDLY